MRATKKDIELATSKLKFEKENWSEVVGTSFDKVLKNKFESKLDILDVVLEMSRIYEGYYMQQQLRNQKENIKSNLRDLIRNFKFNSVEQLINKI